MEIQIIQSKIHILRGQRVMLDFDLAQLYEVDTKRLKETVRRNLERFPEDFMFELTAEEFKNLRSQIATSSWGGSRYAPFAFTEHGVTMLSSILNSSKAIQVNIEIVRAFVALRQLALHYAELAQKITELEAQTGKEIADIVEALRWLGQENRTRTAEIAALQTPAKDWKQRRKIGFKAET